jgi:uncharacterized protein (AIM24 family)
MPRYNPDVPPPFDQGVFLVHYNRGREAFQDGRYAEARRELEGAQKMRPDDLDVLNLLGLVYFKTNAYPEAEVIYRRLVEENKDVFILHSNLGLIFFKQGKLDEAERALLRAVELRPNYSKSHLYLGLLYKQRRKFGLAMEHLQFAGADKAMKEVEAEMRSQQRGASPTAPAEVAPASTPAPPSPPKSSAPSPGAPPPAPPPSVTLEQPKPPMQQQRSPITTVPVTVPMPIPMPIPAPPAVPETTLEIATPTAARKLQEAVDETSTEDRRIDLGRKIEGASKTFVLHENGFLEINFRSRVHIKRGTVSSYSGNLTFAAESGLLGTTAATLVRVDGEGRLFLFERGRKTFLLDLNDEFIYVEGSNLLALEESLSYRVEPIYDATYQRKIDAVKIFGKGSLAISTSIEPLTMRVTRAYPLSISSHALVAWTGNLIPAVIEGDHLESVMINTQSQSFKIRFEGEGIVVSEQ